MARGAEKVESPLARGDPRAKDATAFGVGLGPTAHDGRCSRSGEIRDAVMPQPHNEAAPSRCGRAKACEPEPAQNDAEKRSEEPDKKDSRRCRITPELSRAAKR